MFGNIYLLRLSYKSVASPHKSNGAGMQTTDAATFPPHNHALQTITLTHTSDHHGGRGATGPALHTHTHTQTRTTSGQVCLSAPARNPPAYFEGC